MRKSLLILLVAGCVLSAPCSVGFCGTSPQHAPPTIKKEVVANPFQDCSFEVFHLRGAEMGIEHIDIEQLAIANLEDPRDPRPLPMRNRDLVPGSALELGHCARSSLLGGDKARDPRGAFGLRYLARAGESGKQSDPPSLKLWRVKAGESGKQSESEC